MNEDDLLNPNIEYDSEYEIILNEEIEEKHYSISKKCWNELEKYEDFQSHGKAPYLNGCCMIKFPSSYQLCLLFGVDLFTKESTNEVWIYDLKQMKWERISFNEKRDMNSLSSRTTTQSSSGFRSNKLMNLKPSLRCVEPPARIGSCAVALNETDVFIFSGNDIKNERLLQDCWIYQNEKVKTWKLILPEGEIPIRRWYSSGVKYMDKVFFFGGETDNFVLLNDVSILAIEKLKNGNYHSEWLKVRTLHPTPIPRMLHTATVVNGKMYIIGGLGKKNNEETCNIWCFDLSLLRWEKINPISNNNSPFQTKDKKIKPIYGHSAFPWGNKIVIFGGKRDNTLLDEVWTFDTKKSLWGLLDLKNRPKKRWKHVFCHETIIEEKNANQIPPDQIKVLREIQNFGKSYSINPFLNENKFVERTTKFYCYGGKFDNYQLIDLNELELKLKQKKAY